MPTGNLARLFPVQPTTAAIRGYLLVSLFLLIFASNSATAAKCTVASFDQKAQQCVGQMYDRLTNDGRIDCSAAYKTLEFCLTNARDHCWQDLSPECTVKDILERANEYIANEDFYCKEGTLHSLEAGSITGCSAPFYRRAAEISNKFVNAFQRQRNAPDLCGCFSNTTAQISEALRDECTGTKEVLRLRALYANKFNPFCRKGISTLEATYGRCTTRSYLQRERECFAEFMQNSRAQDCGPNCSTSLADFQSCRGLKAIGYCLQDIYDKNGIAKIIRSHNAKNRAKDKRTLCQGADILPEPKSGCEPGYKGRIEKCGLEVYHSYSVCDASLASKYAVAKACAGKVVRKMCTMTAELDAFVKFFYDDYNPFSSTLHDPEVPYGPGGIILTSPRPTTSAATANTTISSKGHKEPPVALGFALLVFIFFRVLL